MDSWAWREGWREGWESSLGDRGVRWAHRGKMAWPGAPLCALVSLTGKYGQPWAGGGVAKTIPGQNETASGLWLGSHVILGLLSTCQLA